MGENFKLKRFLPFFILVTMAFLAGGTSFFSETIQSQVVEVLKGYLVLAKPMVGNIYIGLVALSLLYALALPIRLGVERALAASGADERGKVVVLRAVRLVYWLAAVLIGVSFIAPAFLAKVFIGIGLFGAALTLALQGLANDLIAGVMLSFSPKVKVGDNIELVGLAVKGTVVDVGYVLTEIRGENAERITVPNRELWARAVKATSEAAAA